MTRHVLRGPDAERGSFAILFAVLVTTLFTMVALTVDMSDARARVRDNQSRVDFAALAASAHLPNDPATACASAWTYLLVNTADLPSTGTSPCASGVEAAFPTTEDECDPAVAREFEALNVDPYEVVFVYPVTDDHQLMTAHGRTADPVVDGEKPCQRFGVRLRHQGGPLFGGIVGSKGLSAPASAVSRGFKSGKRDLGMALLLLDPIGCEPLLASGNGGVVVMPSGGFPGFAAVDSDGSGGDCGGAGQWTTDAQGVNPRIWSCGLGSTLSPTSCTPGGELVIYAMRRFQRTCDTGNLKACEQDDVTMGRLKPQPTPSGERLTRAPVDHYYNCQTGYPVYRGLLEMPDCPNTISDPLYPDRDGDGFTSDYIDELHAELATGTAKPAGFLEYGPGASADVQGNCTLNSGEDLTLPPGNWYVNCPKFSVKSNVEFQGGNIVFQGALDLTSHGLLQINTSPDMSALPASCQRSDDAPPRAICPTNYSSEAGFVVIRDGDFTRQGGAPLEMLNTFFYLAKGRISLAGGAGIFTWTGPYDGPFEALTLWTESTQEQSLAGQSGQNLDGIFFTPHALLDYAGSGTQEQVNAQFISYRLIARGNGSLFLAVNPERAIPFPREDRYLIR